MVCERLFVIVLAVAFLSLSDAHLLYPGLSLFSIILDSAALPSLLCCSLGFLCSVD